MLIDSHCHLNYDYAPKSAADLVREAGENGVDFLITIGTEMASIPAIEKISESFPNVFHTVGVHPHDSVEMKDEDLATLEKAARHAKCRAVGEIGLDYHYDHSPHDIQIQRVREQLALAARVGQPVVIHSREAEAELLAELKTYARSLPAGALPGIIHCFTGTRAFGEACLELGFFISFSGILTFKNAEDLRECAKAFPLENLLVETDSPFLAPIPFRGKKCEPAMVKLTALKIAEVRGIALEDVARVTTANAKRIFRIA